MGLNYCATDSLDSYSLFTSGSVTNEYKCVTNIKHCTGVHVTKLEAEIHGYDGEHILLYKMLNHGFNIVTESFY